MNTEELKVIAEAVADAMERRLMVYPTVTMAEGAKALDISEATMRKLTICEKKIPYTVVRGVYRVRVKDINTYLEGNMVTA